MEKWGVYGTVLCYHPYLVSMLFAWSAIPTSHYIFNVFILVHVLAADACLSWSLPSVTEQQVCPHRLPMKYWLKNHWPNQALFKHSLHTNCSSNSAKSRKTFWPSGDFLVRYFPDALIAPQFLSVWRDQKCYSNSYATNFGWLTSVNLQEQLFTTPLYPRMRYWPMYVRPPQFTLYTGIDGFHSIFLLGNWRALHHYAACWLANIHITWHSLQFLWWKMLWNLSINVWPRLPWLTVPV